MRKISNAAQSIVYNYIKENPLVTTADIFKHFNINRQYAHSTVHNLEKDGYIVGRATEGTKSKAWTVTDKPYTIVVVNPKFLRKKCRPKILKEVEVTIKPDLAAMWLVESRPHWETKFIPIVRSTGPGVRQGTS